MRKESEHTHQKALFDLLKLNENKYPFLKYVFAIPNAAKRSPSLAAYMKAEGLKAGVWDVFVPLPRHISGTYWFHGLFIEMKFGKNKVTDAQNEFGKFVSEQAYRTALCFSWEEAAEAIEKYLNIKLSR